MADNHQPYGWQLSTIRPTIVNQAADNYQPQKWKGGNRDGLGAKWPRLVQQPKSTEEAAIPDIVLSLLGAGEPLDDDDLNGRKAYHNYLEEKYITT